MRTKKSTLGATMKPTRRPRARAAKPVQAKAIPARGPAAKKKPAKSKTATKKVARARKISVPEARTAVKPAARARKRIVARTPGLRAISPETPVSFTAKSPLKIPAILLEGDEPALPRLRGPGQKY